MKVVEVSNLQQYSCKLQWLDVVVLVVVVVVVVAVVVCMHVCMNVCMYNECMDVCMSGPSLMFGLASLRNEISTHGWQ